MTEAAPLRGRLRSGSLRSPPLRRPRRGAGRSEEEQFTEQRLHRRPHPRWSVATWYLQVASSPLSRTRYSQGVSDDTRPNPDALLAAIQKQDARVKRGKLKVFFGMAPGVGKTYAMLEAARRELAGGRDVVIGLVETHGRKETDALTEGLPVIPRLTLQ